MDVPAGGEVVEEVDLEQAGRLGVKVLLDEQAALHPTLVEVVARTQEVVHQPAQPDGPLRHEEHQRPIKGCGEVAGAVARRDDQQVPGRRQQEGLMLPLRCGRGVLLLQLERVDLTRVGHISHIEQRQLQPQLAALHRSLAAQPDDGVVVVRVEVAREAGDLQLAQNPRVSWVGQVDDEERVHLPKRHHEQPRGQEAGREDALAWGDAVQLAQLPQVEVQAVHLVHRRPALHRRRHSQHCVVLVHRELVVDPALHSSVRKWNHVVSPCKDLVDDGGVGAGIVGVGEVDAVVGHVQVVGFLGDEAHDAVLPPGEVAQVEGQDRHEHW